MSSLTASISLSPTYIPSPTPSSGSSGRGYVDPNIPIFRPAGLISLGALYFIITFIACIMYWRYRGHYHIRITSIPFTFLTAFGGLLVTASEVYVRSSSYAVCFVHVIVVNTGLSLTFSGVFARVTRVLAAIVAKKKSEQRRKNAGNTSKDKGAVRSGNESASVNTDLFETSITGKEIGSTTSPQSGNASKWLSPISSNIDTQKQAKEERRKAKESDLLSSTRKKSLDPEFFDWRMCQNVILIVLLAVALTVGIAYVSKGFDNPDINQCEKSNSLIPRYVVDSIILMFLGGAVTAYVYVMKDSRETLGVRDDMKLLQMILLPFYTLTVLWCHVIDRFLNDEFAKYFPGSVLMIFSMLAVQGIIILKPLLYSYWEIQTLQAANPSSKEDFQKILNSPGLFRLFLDFCLGEGHPENIVFVREMKDVFFKVRGLDDAVVVPDHLRATYKAVFHRYIHRGSRLELPLPPTILQQLKDEFDNRDTLTVGCFNRAHSHILSNLFNNSFPRFMEAYKSGKINPSKISK